MSTVKKLSEYYGDNGRTATVYKNLEEDHYFIVSVKSESGSSFQAIFENVDFAEDYAEEWVLKKNE
jgi:hypothetical protein